LKNIPLPDQLLTLKLLTGNSYNTAINTESNDLSKVIKIFPDGELFNEITGLSQVQLPATPIDLELFSKQVLN